jgi:hypothetical protein
MPVLLLAIPALASPSGVKTEADTIHPAIHTKVGQAGNSDDPEDYNANANPNGANANGGNIHGIANVPGKGGGNPNDDGVAGFANQLKQVHGGIDDVNKNAVIP